MCSIANLFYTNIRKLDSNFFCPTMLRQCKSSGKKNFKNKSSVLEAEL